MTATGFGNRFVLTGKHVSPNHALPIMLYYGTNITAPADPLQPVSVESVYQSLRQPKPRIRQLVDQLRVMQSLDKNAYRQQKKMLPYLVCAAFKPAIRRRENFLNIAYFMIDLDGIAAHFDKQALCQTLTADPRLVLLFTSPGGNGLKLLYRLAQKCTDYGLFSTFYKLFVRELAARYHLHPVLDATTSDVTRACFISYDEQAHFHAAADPVDWSAYINTEEPDTIWEIRAEADAELKKMQQPAERIVANERTAGPGADVLAAIRQRLNPNFRKPASKQYYVPPEVDDYLNAMAEELRSCGMQLLESSPIHYGRKLKIGAGSAWAEINLFYGKRGFTFVKTTKTGSHPPLAELCMQWLEQHLYREQAKPGGVERDADNALPGLSNQDKINGEIDKNL